MNKFRTLGFVKYQGPLDELHVNTSRLAKAFYK